MEKTINGHQGPNDDFYKIVDILYEDDGSSDDRNENRNHNSLNSRKEKRLSQDPATADVSKKMAIK
jgi:hypothetical protein